LTDDWKIEILRDLLTHARSAGCTGIEPEFVRTLTVDHDVKHDEVARESDRHLE
jgi:hypothetical protein